MRLRRFASLAPLVLLAACGASPHPVSGPATADRVPPRHDFSGPETKGPQQAASLPAPVAAVTEPARLKGLSPPQVRSVLGKPVFTRRDAPAEIWQYRGRACILDLFLYDEGASQTVAHYTVRSSQPVNETACFDELTARNRGTPTS